MAGSNIKKIPALFLIILIVGLGLVSVSCGGNETDPTDTSDIKKYDRSKNPNLDNESGEVEQTIDNEKVRESITILKSVSLTPEKIQADSTVTIQVETAVPLNENQRLGYIYWKNGKALEETNEAQLPALSIKKKDVLFAEVLLYENDELIARKRTQFYGVANSPPIIEDVVIPDIKGAGTYQFNVKAKDIDNDQLVYSLQSENQGSEESMPGLDTQIDSASGVVTCTLDENPPDLLKFTVVANDGDGGITKKNVSVRFFKRPVREQQ